MHSVDTYEIIWAAYESIENFSVGTATVELKCNESYAELESH